MSARQSVYDVIPLKDLERISAFEEQAAELERKAAFLLADAQELRTMAGNIVGFYRQKVQEHGWEACRKEAERRDMYAWRHDPLPGQEARA